MLSSGAFTHQVRVDIHRGTTFVSRASVPATNAVADLVRALGGCKTPDALRSWLAAFADAHAFRGGRYVHFDDVHPDRKPEIWMPLRFLSTHDDRPDLWSTQDEDSGAVLVTLLPFAWSLPISDDPVDGRRAWMKAHGLESLPAGITVPVQDHTSGPACLVLFGGTDAQATELVEAGAALLIGTALAFHLLAKVLIPVGTVSGGILSDREIACLRLAACGETLAFTANTLGVSVRTVELHVGRATKKLGAANKVHAVAIAVGAGLLQA